MSWRRSPVFHQSAQNGNNNTIWTRPGSYVLWYEQGYWRIRQGTGNVPDMVGLRIVLSGAVNEILYPSAYTVGIASYTSSVHQIYRGASHIMYWADYPAWGAGGRWVISTVYGDHLTDYQSADTVWHGTDWWAKLNDGDYTNIIGSYPGRGLNRGNTITVAWETFVGWQMAGSYSAPVYGEYPAVGGASGTQYFGWRVFNGLTGLSPAGYDYSNLEYREIPVKSNNKTHFNLAGGPMWPYWIALPPEIAILAWNNSTWIISNTGGITYDHPYWQGGANPAGTYTLVRSPYEGQYGVPVYVGTVPSSFVLAANPASAWCSAVQQVSGVAYGAQVAQCLHS